MFQRTFSPVSAWRDLRDFVAMRRPHQALILALSFAGTALVAVGVLYQSRTPPKPYHRDIIYFQQWRADRTDAQIIAQQKIDGIAEERDRAELKRREAERQAQFKRLRAQLKSVGVGS